MPSKFRRTAPPLIALLALALTAPALGQPVLRGATLPSARTVATDATATAFFTVLNAGDEDATDCVVAPSTYVGSDLDDYIITSQVVEGGAATGPVDPVFDIPAAGRVDMVVGVRRDPDASFNTNAYVHFRVECDDGHASPAWPAVNEVRAQFRNNAPDIITISDTLTRDGIMGFNANRVGVIAVAAINIGAGDPADADGALANEATHFISLRSTAPTDSGERAYQACETDADGVCLAARQDCITRNAACIESDIGDTPTTYTFFVSVRPEEGVEFRPNTQRLTANFNSPTSFSDAATGVAVGAIAPEEAQPTPYNHYTMHVRNDDDAEGSTLNVGAITVTEEGSYGYLLRAIDRGAFTEISRQHFFGQWGEQPEGGAWEMGLALLDTRPEGDERPNDHFVVDPESGSCSFTLGAGGQCRFADSESEQIPGEPDIFDAGEANRFTLYINQTTGPGRLSNPSLTDLLRDMREWGASEPAASGFDDVDIERVEDSGATETRSDAFTLTVDGCDLIVVFESDGAPESSQRVFMANVQISGDCPEDHPMRAIAESAGRPDGAFRIPVTAERPFFQGEGATVLEFTLAGDLADPEAPKTTIRVLIS